VFRVVAIAVLSLGLALGPAAGCAKKAGPEDVADAFADAYFRLADQEKAKEYTAFGATQMLDAELKSVEQIRKDGYTPSEAGVNVTVRRGASSTRDQRVRIPYEVAVHPPSGGAETVRVADVELTQIAGVWKVVRVGMEQH
jgi:hypothetical protein